MGSLSVEIRPAEVHVEAGPTLEVVVLFTDIPSTQSALRTAAQLAQGLSARIRLVVLQCVPYPLDLDQPQVKASFLRRQFQTLVERSAIQPETVADIRLCRSQWDGVRGVLKPGSVVVIGTRSRWWPHPENGLARKLRAAGHHVVRTTHYKEVSTHA